MAPMFWGIKRKLNRFVVTVDPGPHPKNYSIPLAVFLRDKLQVVFTLREAKSIIYNRMVTVDGTIRRSIHHGIGLMDVIQLQNVFDIYRLVPQNGKVLTPIKVIENEKSKKIIKVTSKTTVKGGKTQVGFHDGRTMLVEQNISVGDSCLISIPEQKILKIIKLENECQALIIKGMNSGKIGTIKDIKKGTFLLPRRVLIIIDKQQIEIPLNIIMVVGKKNPMLNLR